MQKEHKVFYYTGMKRVDDAVIAVGLSGGVDSSVALYLLQQKYSHIVGASHDICTDSLTCNEETLGRARLIAERLDVPYYRFDLISEFSQAVIDDFTDEYARGRTPNPCVRCNERIRFNLFYQRCMDQLLHDGTLDAQKAFLFATGHYARIAPYQGSLVIQKGKDLEKDQSYMLYRITKEHLPSIRFPLGEYTKREIIAIAKREGFPISGVRESQDICFIPGKYIDKLIEVFGEEQVTHAGDIVDEEGHILGRHRGYMHYTIGQRQGLGLSDGPWYVKYLDAEENTVVVGRKDDLLNNEFTIRDTNWFVPPEYVQELSDQGILSVKIRYNSPEQSCLIREDRDLLHTVVTNPTSITPGQSAVYYDGEYLLGGGIIDTIIS